MATTVTTLQDVIDQLKILTKVVLSSKTALSIEEAAAYTGLAVSYLYKLTSTQEVPHYKPRGKMIYFNRDELDQWLLQNRVKPLAEIDKAAVSHLVRA
jgi:excisionase family DNA binding protein